LTSALPLFARRKQVAQAAGRRDEGPCAGAVSVRPFVCGRFRSVLSSSTTPAGVDARRATQDATPGSRKRGQPAGEMAGQIRPAPVRRRDPSPSARDGAAHRRLLRQNVSVDTDPSSAHRSDVTATIGSVTFQECLAHPPDGPLPVTSATETMCSTRPPGQEKSGRCFREPEGDRHR
jgi:hypothetical protein